MLSHSANDSSIFSGKVRVRVCGILQNDDKILLLKHRNIGPAGYLWSPPGGGVEFGKSLENTLKQEFLEETNLEIEVKEYLFANEYIGEQHHAIELFFRVTWVSGVLQLGTDPELTPQNQILTEAKFFNVDELNLIPENAIHNAFIAANTRDKIADIRGLLTFKH